MRQALAGDAPDELRQVTHSFKSSSAFMGAQALVDLCQRMEAVGRDRAPSGAEEVRARIEAGYAAAYRTLSVTLKGESQGE
jgi:HPt (histidine-containing phosphotransfer) domain-containing protein